MLIVSKKKKPARRRFLIREGKTKSIINRDHRAFIFSPDPVLNRF